MTLPPEILDKILEHVPADDRQTLMACALVAIWWTGPCQRRLFSSVSIHEDNYERWMGDVVLSQSNTNLLGYVRSLHHSRGLIGTIKYQMRDLAQDSGVFFSALRNLHTLTLHNFAVEHIGDDQFHACFSAFRDTLTYLFINDFSTSFSAFVALVGYFPNIATLELCSLELKPDEGPVPSLSRPLRGKLHIHEVQGDYLEFFNRFAKLDLEYEELVIDSPYFLMGMEFVESALRISMSTVRFLRLTTVVRCG